MPLASIRKIDKVRRARNAQGTDRRGTRDTAALFAPMRVTEVELMAASRAATAKKPAKESRRRSPKKGPRSKAEQRAETLERILDAAEMLFSKYGLYGVTLRDVAKEVGVHTSLMHYYFKDKLALFKAVFARRASLSSGRRMKALDEYEKQARGKRSWTRTSISTSRPAARGITPPSAPSSPTRRKARTSSTSISIRSCSG